MKCFSIEIINIFWEFSPFVCFQLIFLFENKGTYFFSSERFMSWKRLLLRSIFFNWIFTIKEACDERRILKQIDEIFYINNNIILCELITILSFNRIHKQTLIFCNFEGKKAKKIIVYWFLFESAFHNCLFSIKLIYVYIKLKNSETGINNKKKAYLK
jgi:hypothetical protein